jgi:hypothetical protein
MCAPMVPNATVPVLARAERPCRTSDRPTA